MTDEPLPADEREERIDAAIAAYLEAADAGRPLRREEFLSTYPDLADELAVFLADHEQVGRMTHTFRKPIQATAGVDTVDFAPEQPAEDWSRPNRVGPYQLGRLLGEGGMARVYEGRDAQGRLVAVKLIAPQYAASPTTLERFRQEGRLASRINHPRCVFVLTADHEAGQPYIVMELMSGPTLKEYVERRGPLEPAQAVAKVLDVIEGLEQAHRIGMIHRDVKPGNCYLNADGHVKIGDFGLSRSLTRSSELTQSGTFVGTPLFASPEQLRGEKVDLRTDVYSTAATLYYLLTGQPPFGHVAGPALIARVVSEAPPPPRSLRYDVPLALEQAVMRGLERSRDRRYQTLAELREALAATLPATPTAASLGLRIGAYAVDSVILSVFGQVVMVLTAMHITFAVFAAGEIVGLVYYWLCEGLWGCTPGKSLVRLSVVRAGGTTPGGLVRVFVRSAIFLATSGAPVVAILLLFVDQSQGLTWIAATVGGVVLGLALRFAPARPGNGFLCLHDLLSGTRVVQSPAPRAEAVLPVTLARDLLTGPRPAHVPERLGAFLVRGTLTSHEGEMLLLAEDDSLHRSVWLYVRPRSQPALGARCELARPGRLRWLASDERADLRWDAFVAPDGAPLERVAGQRTALTWVTLGRILESLTDELLAADADGSMPQRLGLDQVWVQSTGQVTLLDWWPAGGGATDKPRPVQLLGQVVAAVSEPAPIRGPRQARLVAPLQVRTLLLRLLGQGPPLASLGEVQRELDRARALPAVTSPRLRGVQMGIVLATVGFALLLTVLLSRMAALAWVVRDDVLTLRAQALVQILEDAPARERLASQLPAHRQDSVRTRWAEHDRKLKEWIEQHVLATAPTEAGLGYLERLVLNEVRRSYDLPTTGIVGETGADGRFRITTRQHADVRSLVSENVVHYAPVMLDQAEAHEGIGERTDAWRVCLVCVLVLAACPLLMIAWSIIWPGGLSFRLAGLALVNGRGEPCGRLRSGWRALLIWAPVIVVLFAITAIDCFVPAWAWAAVLLQGVYVAILVAYGVLPLRFPERGLHDWLASTYVVPR